MSKQKINLGGILGQHHPLPPAPELPMPMPTVAVPADQLSLVAPDPQPKQSKTRKAAIKAPPQEVVAQPQSRMGRPRRAGREDEVRTTFGLSPELSKRLKVYLIENDLTLQEFLTDHIERTVGFRN